MKLQAEDKNAIVIIILFNKNKKQVRRANLSTDCTSLSGEPGGSINNLGGYANGCAIWMSMAMMSMFISFKTIMFTT